MIMFLISLSEFGDIKCQKYVKLQKKELCRAIMSHMQKIGLEGSLNQIYIIIDYGQKFKKNGSL